MMIENQQEKRSETRELLDRYYSVEFLIEKTGKVYQFKLRDLSERGLGILVREDSEVLHYVTKGGTLDVQFNPPRGAGPAETFKTRVRHITKRELGATSGHLVIGLEIIARQADEG